MTRSPTCKLRIKHCKIEKKGKNGDSENMFETTDLVADNIRNTIIKQGPLFMSSRSQLIWVCLMECLYYIGCIHKVFGWFPTCCIRGIVEAFPLDEVQ